MFKIRLNGSNRRGWIYGQANFLAQRFYFLNERWDLVAELDVDDHFIRPGFGKGFKQDFRLGTHEVNIEKQFRERTHRLDHLRAEGNVGHKVTIHDVEVQPVATGSLRTFGPLAEAGVIRSEQRWGDNYIHDYNFR